MKVKIKSFFGPTFSYRITSHQKIVGIQGLTNFREILAFHALIRWDGKFSFELRHLVGWNRVNPRRISEFGGQGFTQLSRKPIIRRVSRFVLEANHSDSYFAVR